jgi:hypothetical protein
MQEDVPIQRIIFGYIFFSEAPSDDRVKCYQNFYIRN